MCLAVPGKLIETDTVAGNRIGKVEFGGITRQVYLDLVPEAAPGDYVLVHVGFAISRLDPHEAHETFEYLRQLGDMESQDPEP